MRSQLLRMLTTVSPVFFIIVAILLPVHGRVIHDVDDIPKPTSSGVHDITKTPSSKHDMNITDPTSIVVTIGQPTEAGELSKNDNLGDLTKGKQPSSEEIDQEKYQVEIDQEEDQLEIDQVIEHALHGDSASASDGHGGTRQELDMWLTREQDEMLHGGQVSRQKRKADSWAMRWSNNEVWYRRAPGVFSDSEWRTVEKAMREWEERTCLTFHEDVDETHYNHVYIDTGDGYTSCSSYVGVAGGRQPLTLGPGCVYHTVILHEIGHAIGLLHEHNRPDRDNYVKIWWKNIDPEIFSPFEKYHMNRVNYYDVPYDFLSVMHYGPRAFSKNRNYTIVAIDPQYQGVYGHPPQLSFYDVMLANRMYKCDAKCDQRASCLPGSYRGKDCKCYCRGPTHAPVQECDHAPVTSPPVTQPSCRDLHAACSSWTSSSRQICYTHANIKKLCPLSCGTCEAPAPKTTITTEPATTRTTSAPITTSITTTTIGTSRRPTTSRTTTSRPTEGPWTRRSTTRRPTTTTSHQTTTQSCTDWKRACPHWTSIPGICKMQNIRKLCPVSCGTCGAPKTTTITEIATTKTTSAPITTLTTTTTIGTSRRPTTSRLTKGPCIGRPTTRRPTTRRPTTRRPTTTTTPHQTTTPRQSCTDWNGACPHWASIPGICQRQNIRNLCRKSCGYCTV